MSYDARRIANWFINRAEQEGKSLSIMTLLKLTYIAHGWHLEMRNAPLFDNKIEAWQYGPVIPDVYNEFRDQGISIKRPTKRGQHVQLEAEDESLLEQVYNVYAKLSPFQLSDLTHISAGPWDIARQAGNWYAPIPDDLIKQHYVQKRVEANRRANVKRNTAN